MRDVLCPKCKRRLGILLKTIKKMTAYYLAGCWKCDKSFQVTEFAVMQQGVMSEHREFMELPCPYSSLRELAKPKPNLYKRIREPGIGIDLL